MRQVPAVRRSCQPSPGPTGSPVARSHTIVDARWLAMPSASTGPPAARVALVTSRAAAARAVASNSTRPGAGVSGSTARCCACATAPSGWTIDARTPLVPMSTTTMLMAGLLVWWSWPERDAIDGSTGPDAPAVGEVAADHPQPGEDDQVQHEADHLVDRERPPDDPRRHPYHQVDSGRKADGRGTVGERGSGLSRPGHGAADDRRHDDDGNGGDDPQAGLLADRVLAVQEGDEEAAGDRDREVGAPAAGDGATVKAAAAPGAAAPATQPSGTAASLVVPGAVGRLAGAHGHGASPNGDGRPSLPGLRIPRGSRLAFSDLNMSKLPPRAWARWRPRLSPIP